MLSKRQFLSLALVVFGSVTLCAKPICSLVGSEGCRLAEEDSGPINLWEWPQTSIRSGAARTPRSVWTPQLGTWYEDISPDGYVFYSGSSKMVDFSEASITTSFRSGYSCGTFIPLEPGHYVLGCDVDGRAQFRISFYKKVEGGYLFNSWTALSVKESAGYYERVFTVPEGCSLVALLPTSSQGSAPPLTVTNIEIYRLD